MKLVVQKVQYDERIFAEILVIVTSLSQNSVRKTSQLTSTDEAKYLNLTHSLTADVNCEPCSQSIPRPS